MESNEIGKKKLMNHFIKVNIFGYSGVGKSSLISWFKNYENENFKIKDELKNSIDDSIELSKSLVEQIQKAVIPINDERNIYYLLYESNLNRIDSIKFNLDTLLVQTEYILIMWDNSHSTTFDNIFELINDIIKMINQGILDNIDIFLIQNKSDLEFDISQEGETEEEINKKIDELKQKYKKLYFTKISLLNKDHIISLLYNMDKNYNPEERDKNNNINSVKVPYPLKAENEKAANQKYINIGLVGAEKTGKSSFLKYLFGPNNDNNDINFKIEIENEKNFFTFLEHPQIPYYKKIQGFLLFYDVTNEKSFELLKNDINQIRDNSTGCIIILANKIDQSDNRKVKKSVGKRLANDNNCKYFECSCENGININEIFNEIILDSYHKFLLVRQDSVPLMKTINRRNEKTGCCHFG